MGNKVCFNCSIFGFFKFFKLWQVSDVSFFDWLSFELIFDSANLILSFFGLVLIVWILFEHWVVYVAVFDGNTLFKGFHYDCNIDVINFFLALHSLKIWWVLESSGLCTKIVDVEFFLFRFEFKVFFGLSGLGFSFGSEIEFCVYTAVTHVCAHRHRSQLSAAHLFDLMYRFANQLRWHDRTFAVQTYRYPVLFHISWTELSLLHLFKYVLALFALELVQGESKGTIWVDFGFGHGVALVVEIDLLFELFR